MKTGVIGLGAMGAPMALNLHRAGHLHRIWNRTRAKAEDIAAQTGVTVAESVEALAAECELIITCVSRDPDVLAVAAKVAAGIRPEAIVVDTSTVDRRTALEAAALIAARGASFLDCPVTGGVEGARKGTLSLMAGGDAAVLDRARETLASIAGRITLIGPAGSGQACKAVNQVICAGINQAVTEGLAFGEALELDMDRVLDAISGGAAGNWFMDHRGQTMLAGRYEPGFKLSLHHKDLGICLDMAAGTPATDLPLSRMTAADYEKLMAAGHGNEDISALYRLKKPSGSR